MKKREIERPITEEWRQMLIKATQMNKEAYPSQETTINLSLSPIMKRDPIVQSKSNSIRI